MVRVFIEASTAAGRQRLTAAAVRAGWRVVDRRDDADAMLAEPVATAGPSARRDPDALGAEPAAEEERPREALTPRERDVLVLLAEGAGNREIAERLGVTEHTVKFHLGAIFGKLGAATRTEAVRRALRWGWVDL